MSTEPRPGLRDVEPYVSPQPEAAVRLNTNECAHRLPESYYQMLSAVVREIPLQRYPDTQMTRLRQKLADHTGQPIEGVWAANGSNEILAELLQAYGGPGRTAVVFQPTYLLHGRLAWLANTDLMELTIPPPFRLRPRDAAAAVAREPDVIFVCSPNNPTGNAQPLRVVETLASTSSALVIVDEAYIEFGGESAISLMKAHANIVIVRTLSKAFALAGARIGYCLAWPQVIEDLQRVRLPYHMSTLTQAAGIAALLHVDDMAPVLEEIRKQRDRLVAELGAIEGGTVFPSDANFVLFEPPGDAGRVWQGLLDRGVLVRDMRAVVPNALRITVGTEQELDQMLGALREVLAE